MLFHENLVGIDLGTSYSSISILSRRKLAKPVVTRDGEPHLRSLVYFGDDVPNGYLVGAHAEERALESPNQVVFNAKTFLGTNQTWSIQGRTITPKEVLRCILSVLKEDAEKMLNGEIDQAVISVPVDSSIQQRWLTRSIADELGINAYLIDEPVAAALARLVDPEVGLYFTELKSSVEERIAICDLGGGTLDVCVVNYSGKVIDVIAATGDRSIGGNLWNEALANLIYKKLCSSCGRLSKTDDEEARVQINRQVERVKRLLSTGPRAVACVYCPKRKFIPISLEEFEDASKDLVSRVIEHTKATLKKAGVSGTVSLYLVGGGSQMPMIKNGLSSTLHQEFKIQRDADPSVAVSNGAAYYAGWRAEHPDGQEGEGNIKASPFGFSLWQRTQIRMRAPQDLSLMFVDEDGNRCVHRLLRAGDQLPSELSFPVYTLKEGQRRAILRILAGKMLAQRMLWEKNSGLKTVCECALELPEELPSNSAISVTFYHDQNGLIHLSGNHWASKRNAVARVRYEPKHFSGIKADLSGKLSQDTGHEPAANRDQNRRKTRSGVFVSYSHEDKGTLEELKKWLRPYIRDTEMSVWDDSQIKPGADWMEEIRTAMSRARVAVLLVSQSFLASDFIATNEVPVLLDAAKRDGLTIIWIHVSLSAYNRTPIARYQAAHDASKPLDELTETERRKVMLKICEAINICAMSDG